jgi:hypothetical protein
MQVMALIMIIPLFLDTAVCGYMMTGMATGGKRFVIPTGHRKPAKNQTMFRTFARFRIFYLRLRVPARLIAVHRFLM